MSAQLDRTLLYLTKRRPRPDGLTREERIAANVLWRDGVKVSILARAFRISRNTLYYKAITGEAPSYPLSPTRNSAAETNAIVDSLGIEEARRQFVTPEMINAVNAEMRAEVARKGEP